MSDRARHSVSSTQATSPLQQARRRWIKSGFGYFLRRTEARLCKPGALPVHGIHRILVCRVNHRLGNNILISPLLDELARLYPGAEVDIVSAGESARELFANRFHVHRVLCFPRRMARHPLHTLQLLRDIRSAHYDLAIDPCVNSHSGRLLLGLCQARHKLGFPIDTDNRYHAHRPRHMAKCGVFLLRTACAGTHEGDWPSLRVDLAPTEHQQGRTTLINLFPRNDANDPTPPIIGIFAHASGNKRLPEAWWVEFVGRLQKQRPQWRLVNVLAHHGHSQLPHTVPPVYSCDLRKLASVLAGMQGFISGDCGVMHLAAAVGTPTLGLFTRSNRDRYTPYGNDNRGVDLVDGNDPAHAARMAIEWLDHVTRCGGSDSVRRDAAGFATSTPT
ncbi:MAG TPA: glycosyltransferase family 9 protein [Rhodanobacteraceae bacterium]|nr:glycosyltransferase family 9 protein [Rhodanobacteraceae bacterium]